ncbi:hypothetical protein FVE85_6206 [Porphyridium purpureum]|uniref:Uncharacterized protein n=1 Tax=Porphyridium purpureum TaxID=35688 RepID=A0A5J4Z447_PORPP|nr:hypothetical protein FVE85_6206 [Porphyridium purpureum]|eukprot:POR3817..scf295_1
MTARSTKVQDSVLKMKTGSRAAGSADSPHAAVQESSQRRPQEDKEERETFFPSSLLPSGHAGVQSPRTAAEDAAAAEAGKPSNLIGSSFMHQVPGHPLEYVMGALDDEADMTGELGFPLSTWSDYAGSSKSGGQTQQPDAHAAQRLRSVSGADFTWQPQGAAGWQPSRVQQQSVARMHIHHEQRPAATRVVPAGASGSARGVGSKPGRSREMFKAVRPAGADTPIATHLKPPNVMPRVGSKAKIIKENTKPPEQRTHIDIHEERDKVEAPGDLPVGTRRKRKNWKSGKDGPELAIGLSSPDTPWGRVMNFRTMWGLLDENDMLSFSVSDIIRARVMVQAVMDTQHGDVLCVELPSPGPSKHSPGSLDAVANDRAYSHRLDQLPQDLDPQFQNECEDVRLALLMTSASNKPRSPARQSPQPERGGQQGHQEVADEQAGGIDTGKSARPPHARASSAVGMNSEAIRRDVGPEPMEESGVARFTRKCIEDVESRGIQIRSLRHLVEVQLRTHFNYSIAHTLRNVIRKHRLLYEACCVNALFRDCLQDRELIVDATKRPLHLVSRSHPNAVKKVLTHQHSEDFSIRITRDKDLWDTEFQPFYEDLWKLGTSSSSMMKAAPCVAPFLLFKNNGDADRSNGGQSCHRVETVAGELDMVTSQVGEEKALSVYESGIAGLYARSKRLKLELQECERERARLEQVLSVHARGICVSCGQSSEGERIAAAASATARVPQPRDSVAEQHAAHANGTSTMGEDLGSRYYPVESIIPEDQATKDTEYTAHNVTVASLDSPEVTRRTDLHDLIGSSGALALPTGRVSSNDDQVGRLVPPADEGGANDAATRVCGVHSPEPPSASPEQSPSARQVWPPPLSRQGGCGAVRAREKTVIQHQTLNSRREKDSPGSAVVRTRSQLQRSLEEDTKDLK